MQNITFRVEEKLIEQAQVVARARKTALNEAFREWLQQYVSRTGDGAAVDVLTRRFKPVRSAGPYTRDEMNER